MLVSLTVGKVDAGVAVLLTEDKRLIEFPSILLPPDIASGSIVDITVARNLRSEAEAAAKFHRLQDEIYRTFGVSSPSPPVLRCRNATQTSVVLEWDPISLATAELRSLSLYRNGAKAGSIPRPMAMQSTKISGLAVDTEYVFHLVLRTSAGTHSSERLAVRTHKMTDLSGITVTPGVMPAPLRESLAVTIDRIGAKLVDTVRIDTTHFVCTEGRGQAWEKAMEMNIPIVVPDWIKGCEREGRIVGVRGYYLNADPRLRQVGPGTVERQAAQQVHQQQRRESQRTEVASPTMERQARQESVAERAREAIRTDEVDEEEEDDAPPPPPPKSEPSLEPPEPKSRIMTEADEPKALKDEVKPAAAPESEDDEEGEDEDEEEKEEGGNFQRQSAQAQGKAAVRGEKAEEEPGGADDESEREFDEVAL